MRRELDDQEKIIEQESKLKAACLEESHFSEPEEQTVIPTCSRSISSQVSRLQLYGDRLDNVSDLAPERDGGVFRASCSRGASDIDRLASLINLPKPELLSFSGSTLDYSKFIRNFETNIENQTTDNRLRLCYLIQYCTGEARSCIEDCVLMDAAVGYQKAKNILHSRYGRPHVIARSHIDKLLNSPQIKASDASELSMLALDMQKCQITLSQLGYVSDVNNSENLRRIVKRLQLHLRSKWADIALSIFDSGREPNFFDLSKFVEERSRVANSMYGIDILKEQSNPSRSHHRQFEYGTPGRITTLSTSTGESLAFEPKCPCCLGTCMDLQSFDKFKNMSYEEGKGYVLRSKLCFNCLRRYHRSSDCKKDKQCTISDCYGKHHLLLHSWDQKRPVNAITQPSVTSNATAVNSSSVKTCLGIVPVTVKGGNGYVCQTYALLDDGADKTLCDERLVAKLNVSSRPVSFQISTVNSEKSQTYGQEIDIFVNSVRENNADVKLKNVWTVKHLPISTRSAATADDIRKISYLSDIEIPDVEANEVMLLIGTDNPEAHIPLEVRVGSSNEPYAMRTRLGWAIRGPVHNTKHNATERSREAANVNFGQCSDLTLEHQLERMWTSDFNDTSYCQKESMSIEDKRALGIMESTISHIDGHYEIGLPWRTENVHLPNNLAQAQSRLNQLKRKLSHDKLLHEMYTKTVTGYIDKCYAKKVEDTDTDSKRIWYLPHHPVLNVNKQGKVRVVFDCAAKYKDTSLNCQLLQGPDFMNSLVAVLTRFRQEKIAVTADIEAMFHQVRVREADCDALRFLWWPGGDLSKCPESYCMRVHLFGATSSPSCAAYALKRTAIDN